MAGQLSKKIGLQSSKEIYPSKRVALGQKLYDALGMRLGKEGIKFGEQGFFFSPIKKKWEVSGWYKKQESGRGFDKGDYNFGFSLGRKL